MREHRHPVDLVSHRLLGENMLSLETVALEAGRMVGAQRRTSTERVTVLTTAVRDAMAELRAWS
ncbi:hypothetical protein [Streptomyces sp. NPDC054863]